MKAEPSAARRYLALHRLILRSARSFRGGPADDLYQQGWMSTTARGNPDTHRTAMAALLAALRSSR